MLLDEALERVEANADKDWMRAARDAVAALALAGGSFTTDDAWKLLREVPVPREPRAMGAVIRELARMGLILPTGEYRKSERPDCHRRPVAVWRGR